jgi:hypothetical protein
MTVSHQAIREVEDAFAAGALCLELTSTFERVSDETVVGERIPDLIIKIKARDGEERFRQTIVYANGSTMSSSV